jgi:hypothetical protein
LRKSIRRFRVESRRNSCRQHRKNKKIAAAAIDFGFWGPGLGANAPNDPPGNSGGRALFGRGATVKVVHFKFSVTVLDDTGDSLKDIFWGRVLFGSVCECDFTTTMRFWQFSFLLTSQPNQ